MPKYGLHVNHPNNKAWIHAADGCAFAQRALERTKDREPYGPERGDENGYWAWFETLQEAQAAQKASGKARLGRCGLQPCREHFLQ
ncbi:MAG: hypothetical protein M1337_06355 [Actinobacteria bacterium]|nr:hypothetical protein [Actinomycetota bacterium]